MLEPSDLSSSIHLMKSTSLAAAAFLLWEWFIMLDDEVDCIWMKPNTILIKSLYLFSRYYALVTQITSVFIIMKLSIKPDIANSTCRAWIFFRAAMLGGLFVALSIIIAIRVYALYNRSRRIGVFLVSLLVAKVVLLVLHGHHGIINVEFAQHCQIPKPPIIDAYYIWTVAPVGVMDVIVVIMTLTKYVSIRGGWRRTPLGALFVRDGVMTYTVIFALALALLGGNLPDTFNLSKNDLFHILFSFFVPMLSISSCRLIINMQLLVLARQDDSTLGISFEMSTINTESRLP